MEMSEGNSLHSYLKQTKISFFLFLQNWRSGGWNSYCQRGLLPVAGKRMWGKCCRRVKMVQILSTLVYKMRPVETILGMEEGKDKGE
jgi:hypothetical protein